MSGNSWRGDSAKTRNHAFEKLQAACVEIETLEKEKADFESSLGRIDSKLKNAENEKNKAMAPLLKTTPGFGPDDPTCVGENPDYTRMS